MKILFLSNNSISATLADWLHQREDIIVWRDALTPAVIAHCAPDLVVSYCYQHIIKPDVLAMLPGKFINLHISLLPYNRGADPNVWSLLENTPRGVSIHVIDAGIDTGPVLVQQAATFDPLQETLGSSYMHLHAQIQKLFRDNWERLRIGAIAPRAQIGAGTYHAAKRFSLIKSALLRADGWDIPIYQFRDRYAELLDPAGHVAGDVFAIS